MPTNAEYERAHKFGAHRIESDLHCPACARRNQRDTRARAAAARRPVAVTARIHAATVRRSDYVLATGWAD